jgi:DNA-directed RNA polymerase specialized sigma24 family protein
MDRTEAFPTTCRTWIFDRLQSGGEGERAVRAELMALYWQPLRDAGQARFGLSAEVALDLVHGFFASRFARREYLARWQESDKRLRHWLWNGLCYHWQEHRRSERRREHAPLIEDHADDAVPDPGVEFDRAFAMALVRQALAKAQQRCIDEDFVRHWHVFERRQLRGESLVAIARDLAVTPDQALVMLRAPRRRFVGALEELLVADGVPPIELPRAVAELLDSVSG